MGAKGRKRMQRKKAKNMAGLINRLTNYTFWTRLKLQQDFRYRSWVEKTNYVTICKARDKLDVER